MAKIKFKMSFEKFSFEYEGDQDKAETQSQIIEVEARTGEPPHLLSDASNNGSGSSRKRGKRGKKSTNDSNATGEKSADSAEESNRSSRSSKSPLRPLVVKLIQEGFFKEKRQVAAVREELQKRGHNYESRGIATVLLVLLRENYLSREGSAGNWAYLKGSKDVPTGS